MLDLDCRRLDLPANLAQQYAPQIAAALDQMTRIERGEKINTTEKRPVGHYWLRNPAIYEPERRNIEEAQRQIAEFGAGRAKQFHQFVLVGIGGSALGPQFLVNAFREPGRTPPIFFLDNTDPEGFARTLRDIGILKETLTIIVSKSGGTPETRSGMEIMRNAYQKAGLDFPSHAAAVTQPGKALDELAKREKWLARFPIWEWVGGRTSLFSPVGLLPAELLGFQWQELLAGARQMDERTTPSVTAPGANPALLLALAWLHLGGRRNLHHMVVLPYSDRLSLLSSYLQQLVMESLGKDGKGLSVFGHKGSTDQHSYVQQLRDGRPDFFAAFVRVLCPQPDALADVEVDPDRPGVTAADYLAAFQEGTAKALHEAGRPSLRISMDRVSERSVGAVVALFERAVGYYAAMIGINAYDQPGVEAGKKAAAGYLDVQQKLVERLRSAGKAMSAAELATAAGTEPGLAADILKRLALNNRFGIRTEGEFWSLS